MLQRQVGFRLVLCNPFCYSGFVIDDNPIYSTIAKGDVRDALSSITPHIPCGALENTMKTDKEWSEMLREFHELVDKLNSFFSRAEAVHQKAGAK